MLATKLNDILTGKNISHYYKIYRKTQWYSKEEMRKFQLKKLNKLIDYSYQFVPFYSKLMKKIDVIPSDIKSIEDLMVFPLLTKEIIQENSNDFIPVNNTISKNIKIGQTGGTTGNILLKRTDANTRSSTWATYKRYMDWMNVKDSDKKLKLTGGHVLNKKNDYRRKIYEFISNTHAFNPYNNSAHDLTKLIDTLNNNKYKLIRGYSQNLFELSQKLDERGLRYNIPAMSTTAEPLMAEHREWFKKVFNADSYDQYGFGEIGGVAYECDHHNGLHVAEERVILEVNDKNELIITDLDNFSMPFIRYWNADQALQSENKCSCGRQSKLLTKIMGRTCDYIYGKNGKTIHWAYFWHLIFESNIAQSRNVKKFQVYQKSDSLILFRIISDKLDPGEEKLIIDDMKNRLGEMQIQFVYEKEIENAPSGKYRPVVNELIK